MTELDQNKPIGLARVTSNYTFNLYGYMHLVDCLYLGK